MKYRILIVDDEEMILSMMRKCLKEEFLIYTADSAKKALELLNLADSDDRPVRRDHDME